MADVKLFLGGCPDPLIPDGEGHQQFREPHATRIAYEYLGGDFTLGYPLWPAERHYQKVEMREARLVEGENIMLYVIPTLHALRSIMVRIHGNPVLAGASFKPVASLYDMETKTYTETTLLDDLFDIFPLTDDAVAYQPIMSGVVNVPAQTVTVGSDTVTIPAQTVPSEGPYFVPEGKTLVLSFKVVALPTDKSVKIYSADYWAMMVAKVDGFDTPEEV